jgi:hypothetical protein
VALAAAPDTAAAVNDGGTTSGTSTPASAVTPLAKDAPRRTASRTV